MREAPAHRAPIANHAMRHQPDGQPEQWAPLPHQIGVLDLGLARERLHHHAAVLFVDPIQVRDAVDVDEVGRPSEAEVEQWHKRLAAGEYLGVLQRGEHRARLLDRGRYVVFERCGLHSMMATTRHSDASPPWNRHGKQPSVIFWSSTSSM